MNIDLLIDSTRELFRDVYNAFENAGRTIASWAADAYNAISNAASKLQQEVDALKGQLSFLKNLVLKGPSLIFDTIGSIVKALGKFFTEIFNGIAKLTWQYTGPLAPIAIVVLAGGLIWGTIWLAKKVYELL